MNQRKRYSATQKVEILREHLENQVAISDLARRYGVHPNILYKWKKQLFEGAVESFGTKHQKHVQGQSVRMSQLEEKLKEKDSLIAEIMADNIRLKKKVQWGDLRGKWVEPDIRDAVVKYVKNMKTQSGLPQKWFIPRLGISSSKYYTWVRRYGQENRHNGHIPRDFWILEREKQAIVDYCKDHIEEGYRRLTYKMIDEDIAAVSPSTVYRILNKHGLLMRWRPLKKSLKRKGFKQPKKPHEHWHIDIAYINVKGTFMYLISVLDGYSRMILHHELRTEMKEWDVQITLQRTIEKYPQAKPRLITDNGSQFISKDFKEYLRVCGLKHARTSVNYPQSNGKIERFHKTLKSEEIRRTSYLDMNDARRQIEKYIHYYNHERLHSALYYLTPKEVFDGKMNQRLKERQHKLDQAARNRRNSSLNESQKNSISA